MEKPPGDDAQGEQPFCAASASGAGPSRPPDVRPKVRSNQQRGGGQGLSSSSLTSAEDPRVSRSRQQSRHREDLTTYRLILESVDVDESALQSPAVMAVEDMLDDVERRTILMAMRFFSI